jgi:hypothetical protein
VTKLTVLFSGLREDDTCELLGFARVKAKHFDAQGKLSDKKLTQLVDKLLALDEGARLGYPTLSVTHLSSSNLLRRTEGWSFDPHLECGKPTRSIKVRESGVLRKLFLQYDQNGMSQAPKL